MLKDVSHFALKLFLLLTLLATFGSAKAWAQDNVWTSIGPEGGSIRLLVIDPQNSATVYARSDSGLFKSTDGGASWNSVGPDVAFSIWYLAINPQNPSILYAATWGGGIFQSTDGAKNWTAVNSGLPTGNDGHTFVGLMAIDPGNPSTLFSIVSWNADGGGHTALFKSTDGGTNWRAVDSAPSGPFFYSLVFDRQNKGTIYLAATDWECTGGSVFKSVDGGTSWVNTSFPTDVCSITLAIDPQNTGTLYAGTLECGDTCGGRVLKSTDGGTNWIPMISGLPWTSVNTLAIDRNKPSTIYAGTRDSGVFESTDGGASWNPANAQLAAFPIYTLATDPQVSGTVYAGTGGGGALKSTDGGTSWKPANFGLTAVNISGLVVAPQTPNALYIWSNYEGISSLLKTTDNGVSWTAMNSALPRGFVSTVAVDPHNLGTMYAVDNASSGAGIFKTTDGGASWKLANSGLPEDPQITAFTLDPQNPTTLYAFGLGRRGALGGSGIFTSTDGGASWSINLAVSRNGFPLIGLTTFPIRTMIVDPQSSGTIYALAGSQVFKSTNAGASWVNYSLIELVHSLVIDPQNPSTVYAAVGPRGVLKSSDGASSWAAVNSGLPDGVYISQLTIDPDDPNTVYAAAREVFKTTDGGANWSRIGSGLPQSSPVTGLALDTQGAKTLYAGTSSGVFAITVGERR
jgi:photosystem II stability/assembly factor-like uncharacterized protein